MDQNPRSVTGGPGDLPPEPGGDQTPTKEPLSRGRKYLILTLVLVMAVTAVVSYFGFRAAKPTRNQQTIIITPSAIPGIPQSQTLSEACSTIPEVLASAALVSASATRDIAVGLKTLPSVGQFQLAEVISGLQAVASSAPPPLAGSARSYTDYFVRLGQMKAGAPGAEVTTADSALLAAKIGSICRTATP